MRKWVVVCVVALALSWCGILLAQEGKVYKSWPEAEKLVQKSWRPIVVAFVQQGNSEFMGPSSSVMGDKKFKNVLKYFVLVQVDLAKKGTDENLKVVDDKNNPLMSKVLGQAKTLPIFAVAGPDMKPLKVWEKADPAVVRREVVDVLKDAKNRYDPLDDSKVKEAESLLKRAAKLEEEGKDEEVQKTLKKVVRMNKDCSLAKQAQEIIDRLKAGKEDPGITDVDDDEDGDEEEKKKPEKPEPKGVTVLIKTDFGNIEIELNLEKAPKTCEYFINLAKDGFYDGSCFGYVERGKLIQCVPDPDKKQPDEIDADFGDETHEVGVVAMVHGSDSRKLGATFYIVLDRLEDRDGEYAVFGKVKNGLMVAKTIGSAKTMNNKPLTRINVSKVEIKE